MTLTTNLVGSKIYCICPHQLYYKIQNEQILLNCFWKTAPDFHTQGLSSYNPTCVHPALASQVRPQRNQSHLKEEKEWKHIRGEETSVSKCEALNTTGQSGPSDFHLVSVTDKKREGEAELSLHRRSGEKRPFKGIRWQNSRLKNEVTPGLPLGGLESKSGIGTDGKRGHAVCFHFRESDWSDASRRRGGCGGRFSQLDGMFCENRVPERARWWLAFYEGLRTSVQPQLLLGTRLLTEEVQPRGAIKVCIMASTTRQTLLFHN